MTPFRWCAVGKNGERRSALGWWDWVALFALVRKPLLANASAKASLRPPLQCVSSLGPKNGAAGSLSQLAEHKVHVMRSWAVHRFPDALVASVGCKGGNPRDGSDRLGPCHAFVWPFPRTVPLQLRGLASAMLLLPLSSRTQHKLILPQRRTELAEKQLLCRRAQSALSSVRTSPSARDPFRPSAAGRRGVTLAPGRDGNPLGSALPANGDDGLLPNCRDGQSFMNGGTGPAPHCAEFEIRLGCCGTLRLHHAVDKRPQI